MNAINAHRLKAIWVAIVYGNAHDDMPLMGEIDRFVFDPTTTREEKKLALRKLSSDVMGLPFDYDEDKELDSYLEQAALDLVTGQG